MLVRNKKLTDVNVLTYLLLQLDSHTEGYILYHVYNK